MNHLIESLKVIYQGRMKTQWLLYLWIPQIAMIEYNIP